MKNYNFTSFYGCEMLPVYEILLLTSMLGNKTNDVTGD